MTQGEIIGVVGADGNPPNAYHTRRCHSFERLHTPVGVTRERVRRTDVSKCDKCKWDWELPELDLGEFE